MRLWDKSFGRETKVTDFAGREMAKGAYNDRNSKYGWNVDHILPVSRGGKTADYNLVCCNIETNDEKADKFPCFTANGRNFEIIRVQNHYEIRERKAALSAGQEEEPEEAEINFYDSAAGIRSYKDLKGIQNKHPFVGSVLVCLNGVTNTALCDFIEELFSGCNINYREWRRCACGFSTDVLICHYDLPLQEDISALLDNCVLLNTYLKYYFCGICLESYSIFFRVDHYEEKADMYREPDFSKSHTLYRAQENTLCINERVRINTDAKEKVAHGNNEFVEYNFVFTELAKNLQKEVNGK